MLPIDSGIGIVDDDGVALFLEGLEGEAAFPKPPRRNPIEKLLSFSTPSFDEVPSNRSIPLS